MNISPTSLIARVLRPPFRLIQSLIQYRIAPPDQQGTDGDKQAAEKNQPTSQPVVGLLASREELRAEPVAALRDGVRDGDEGSLLSAGRRHQCRLPGQLQVEARVRPADQQDQAEVSRPDVERGDQHGSAHGAERDRDHDVPERFLSSSRRPLRFASSVSRHTASSNKEDRERGKVLRPLYTRKHRRSRMTVLALGTL